MDMFDKASEYEQKFRESSISLAIGKAQPKATGQCRYCEEPTKKAFCDAECRDAYEHLERMKRRNGMK